MTEKLKTLKTYDATWKRAKSDPRAYIHEHIKFKTVNRRIIGAPQDGVYALGTTSRSCDNHKTFHQSVDDFNRQIVKIFLENFIHVNQRLPRKDEVTECKLRMKVIFTTHARASKSTTFCIVGELVPKI